MKKILSFLFITTLIFTSCEVESIDPSLDPDGSSSGSGSGNGGGNVTASIVGDWAYDFYRINLNVSTEIMGNTINVPSITELVSSDAIISFRADGTYQIVGDITFEVVSNSMTFTQTANVADNGTYMVNGTDLDMTPSNPAASTSGIPSWNNVDVTISTLTATDLTLDLDSEEVQTVNGATVTTTTVGYGDFIRQ